MLSDRCLSVLPVLSCLSLCDVRALWPNGWTDQDETWHAGRPRPGHIALDGDQAPPLWKGHSPPPNFRPMFIVAKRWMDQDATWHEGRPQPRGLCARWGPSPLPSQKEAEPPIFGPCLLWPNGWMDQDGTWHGGRPWSNPHCARWGYSSPPQKGDKTPPPNFRPIFIVAKRLDVSRCHWVWR